MVMIGVMEREEKLIATVLGGTTPLVCFTHILTIKLDDNSVQSSLTLTQSSPE